MEMAGGAGEESGGDVSGGIGRAAEVAEKRVVCLSFFGGAFGELEGFAASLRFGGIVAGLTERKRRKGRFWRRRRILDKRRE